MVVAGAVCFVTGIAYFFLTQDLPDGNFGTASSGRRERFASRDKTKGTFLELAAKDRRVWMLFFVYGACFGVELTINNIAALYYIDYFGLGLKAGGPRRRPLRPDEHLRPHDGRDHRRQVRAQGAA